jgi:UDPglucose 6-dehydrogenase
MKLDPTSAEILKYTHNTINALRVVFSNEIYEICKTMGANYKKVKEGLLKTTHLPDQYLDCNESARGYSSICFNKDIPALRELSKKLGLDLKLINIIEEANNQFKKTPFKDTRESY